MSVHEHARRVRQDDERRQRVIDELLTRDTPAKSAPDILEEHADLLVRQAIQLRELAAVWRAETTQDVGEHSLRVIA